MSSINGDLDLDVDYRVGQNASQFIASIARVVLGALALSAILGRNFSHRLLHCRDESLFPPFLLWVLSLMRVTGRMASYPFVIVSFLSAFLLCYVRTNVVTSYSLIDYSTGIHSVY